MIRLILLASLLLPVVSCGPNGEGDGPCCRAVAAKRHCLHWRDGYQAGFFIAANQGDWDKLKNWAAKRDDVDVSTDGPKAESVDLGGIRHTYIDTYDQGLLDAKITIADELDFISSHNPDDCDRFYGIAKRWIDRQEPDRIIPPGHF